MKQLIMIKYGELTTKKGNRNFFIKQLMKNITWILHDYTFEIRKDMSRMYIEYEKKDEDNILKELQKVFGIHGIVVCYPVHTNIDDIKNLALELLNKKEFKTFKIETHRALKTFPIPSMEVSRMVGAHILKNMDVKVDVHHPDILLTVEIRSEGSFIYIGEFPGIGGYPVGIQGKGILMLSGGIDSPVAGYLALKRGVDLECLYFESPPHTSIEAKNKVLTLAHILNQYSGHIRVHVVPFTKLQEAIYKSVPDTYIITIMRRMMYRIATLYGHKKKCSIIINGESIGQVASQTLASMVVINDVTNMPVIRPVACMDKLEIIDIAKKIGTYETSILPFEDCCTIFVPKHPVIAPVKEKCPEYESLFDYQSLINECIENIEVIDDLMPKKYQDYL